MFEEGEPRKPKGLNRIVRIGKGSICLRKENLNFNYNYMI
jgi:hypothetical protein